MTFPPQLDAAKWSRYVDIALNSLSGELRRDSLKSIILLGELAEFRIQDLFMFGGLEMEAYLAIMIAPFCGRCERHQRKTNARETVHGRFLLRGR
jgi:hypothetical protein